MTKPRTQLISVDTTPYYHCISRCVRQAYLCGKTKLKSYEHRRSWIEERLLSINEIFVIKVVSYAVMSNHYHVILHVDKEACLELTAKEVINRWQQLFSIDDLINDFLLDRILNLEQQALVDKQVKIWRERLMSISWFMRCMNEKIAREANKEDGYTGRFWQGRFKSQALLDDKALLACMAYVDLNPIRAKKAMSIESSDYTSIKRRLTCRKDSDLYRKNFLKSNKLVPSRSLLMLFKDEQNGKNLPCIPITFKDYVALVDWTGRQMSFDYKAGKNKGSIEGPPPAILTRLGYSVDSWLYMSNNFESKFKTIVGTLYKIQQCYENFSLKQVPGKLACRKHLGA